MLGAGTVVPSMTTLTSEFGELKFLLFLLFGTIPLSYSKLPFSKQQPRNCNTVHTLLLWDNFFTNFTNILETFMKVPL